VGVVDGGGTSAGVVGDARDGNPWVCSHSTHTHECRYRFHMGVGVGGPKFTHGLPVMSITGDMVYLDALDISTTCLSQKLSHRRLGPFPVDRQVSQHAYKLWLPFSMRHLHLVFNVVKLTTAPASPITGHHPTPPPPLEVIGEVEEYLVAEILDSEMFRRRLKFKIKWEGYGPEHDSWEYAAEVHTPEQVADFYRKHLAAPRQMRPSPSHKFLSNN